MTLPFLPAHEIARQIKAGTLTALEVTEAHLAHIEKVDGEPGSIQPSNLQPSTSPGVHAFITLTAARARAQARAIDARLAAGEDPGPLAGVPFTVKDIFCVEGTRSTAASRILANFTAPYTATPVERMEAAGAVMLGKVNLDEFTYGSSTESSAFQPATRNPWDTTRAPGGSSGGSAAAVAAGEGPLSLGTDTAGSIRQPASFCGVVGLKPTYGRVSRYGLIAFGSSLDCPGPLSRNVTDAALMLNAIAGPDPHDATAATVPVPDYTEGIYDGVKGMRIGLSPDYFRVTFFDAQTGELHESALPAEIRDATLRAAELLARAGAEIVENIPMPHTQYGIPAYFVISRVEAASNLHRFDGVKYGYRTPDRVADLREMYRKTRAQGFGSQPKLRILMGMYVSAAQYSEQYYNRALRVRSLIRRDFDEAFDAHGAHRLHALLTPSTPSTAFPIGDVFGDTVLMQYSDQLNVPANHAGTPGISLPAGLDGSRLPIGIQLLGPDFSEATLLRIGRAYEVATEGEGWREARPKVVEFV
jgi:aspartyl-tRNA(Asn)/glutamyl-tRNA(Gln) amidotransferase subunit A